VTGASSGLGAEFARAFAARGYDLLLVARRRKRLEIMAAEAAVKHCVTAELLPADLSSAEDVARVVNRLAAAERIDALVHCAGYGLEGPFATCDIDAQMQMIDVHITAGMRLTRAVLPGMVARASGSVVLVSSLGAYAPLPGFAVYGAAKAYVIHFVRSLAIELQDTGVRVQALCPGFTRTEFQEHEGADLSVVPRFMWSTPERVVASSLRALDDNRVVCVPGVLNRMASHLAGPFGAYIQRRIAPDRGWTTHLDGDVRTEEAVAPRQAS